MDWLYARQRFGVRPGLERVRALLGELGNPQAAFSAVLVGGTNGKGSTSAALAAILQAEGRRTGLFTSPHLTRFSERFVVNGIELPQGTVLEGLGRVGPVALRLDASFFEIITALACWLFAEAGVESAVMEVGLGGRLDATNALEPVLSVITSVGLDHTEILGDTLPQIALEKAGILRPAVRAITGAVGEALGVLQERARVLQTPLWRLDHELRMRATSRGWDGWTVDLEGPFGAFSFETPLLGAHGARNAALAAAAARALGVGSERVRRGSAAVRWPGRLERLRWRGGELLLDGAHNPDGAQALADTLRDLGAGRLPLIFGAAADKDLRGVAAALDAVASEVILTRALLSPRAADPEALRALFTVPTRVVPTPQAALEALPPGRAVAAGSLYLIGELRPLLLGEADEGRERWQ
nr:folylpolyglutamate synthase/dihydrofolate synthase family protein [Deinobacterium chartae]